MSATTTTGSTAQTRPKTSQKTKDQNFAHNSNNTNGISIVLPRVFPVWNTTHCPNDWPLWRKIKAKFIECGWGFVERVDVTPPGRIPKGRFKTAFIHFRKDSWNMRDSQARDVLEEITKGPQSFVKITYDEPWYWKVYISSANRADGPPKLKPRPQITIGVGLTVDTSYRPVSPTYGPNSPAGAVKLAISEIEPEDGESSDTTTAPQLTRSPYVDFNTMMDD
jgi:hypothetical protein